MEEVRNTIKLALIGPALSGKSTFIASLASSKIRDELLKIASPNTSGQTEIAVHYVFDTSLPDDTFTVDSLYFENDESLSLKEGDIPKIVEKLPERLKFVLQDGCSSIQLQDRHCTIKIQTPTILKTFYDNIVNTTKNHGTSIDKNCTLRLKRATVRCSPCAELRSLLTERDSKLILVDTKGFSPNPSLFTPTDVYYNIVHYSKQSEYLKNHGLIDTDVCLYFNGSGNTMSTKIQECYRQLLHELVKYKPVLILEQSAFLSHTAKEDTQLSEEYIKQLLEMPDNTDNNFKRLPEFLKKSDPNSGPYFLEDSRKKIYDTYFVNFLLARYNTSSMQFYELYVKTTIFAIKSAFEYFERYRLNLQQAYMYCKHLATSKQFNSVDVQRQLSTCVQENRTKDYGCYQRYIEKIKTVTEPTENLFGPQWGISTNYPVSHIHTTKEVYTDYSITIVNKHLKHLECDPISKIYLDYIYHIFINTRWHTANRSYHTEHIWLNWMEYRKNISNEATDYDWFIEYIKCYCNYYWELFSAELEDFFDCFTGTFIKSKPTQE